METFNQRRISDVSFVVDKNLNVFEGNRSFLRLFSVTDPHLHLAHYMDEADRRNFSHYLEHFPEGQEGSASVASQNPYFIVSIKPKETSPSLSCLLYVARREDGLFKIDVKELSYSKVLLDRALLESREYRSLLQNFDAYYYVFDGAKFTLKNTKDATSLFEGSAEDFEDYFSNNFQLSHTNEDTKAQLTSMIVDSLKFTANKIYKLLKTDKELVTVHTVRTSTRSTSLIIGSIATGGSGEQLVQNLYSEDKDGLTGLYNKKSITELAIQKVNEAKNPVSLIVMDVDKFKECNDTYGHAFGDKVLIAVSNCIKDAIKGIGIGGRIGGDEFLIVLDKTEEEDIRTVARNIRTGLQWSITAVDPANVVTCSMGIARHPLNAKNYDDLFKIADKCLYIAKNKGRNCYIIYKPEMHDPVIIHNEKNANEVATGEYFGKSAMMEVEIFTLINDGKIEEAVKKLVDYIQMNSVSVYDLTSSMYKKFERIFYSEKKPLNHKNWTEKSDFRQEYFASDGYHSNYFKYFNDNDFLHLDNTAVLDTIDQSKYEMYKTNDIASTLEVLAHGNGAKTRILVCYDLFKPSRTFPKEKIIFAIAAARLIALKLD